MFEMYNFRNDFKFVISRFDKFSAICNCGLQAKSYQIPTIRLFSQYGTATGGIEHAAGLVTPLGTNPRGG